eukprot:7176728-Prymnesium_polylepis.1
MTLPTKTTSASLGSRPFSLVANCCSLLDVSDRFDLWEFLEPPSPPSPTLVMARGRLASFSAARSKSNFPLMATVMMGTSRLSAVQISNSASGSVTSAFVSTTTTASLWSIHSAVDAPPPMAQPRLSLTESSERSTRAWFRASALEQHTKTSLALFVTGSFRLDFNR